MSVASLLPSHSPPASSSSLADVLEREVRAALEPPARVSLPVWADTYRILPKGAGRVSGPWETARVEIARGPMLAVTEPGVRFIDVMSCTQLLKTDFLLNVFGFYAHTRPAPILILQPKDPAAESFSKERLTPMVRATPVLRERVGTGRTRTSEETITYKAFPGGFVALAGAGSPDNLARRPICVALCDEIDKYPITREGDPLALVGERLATFGSEALLVAACSPTVEDESPIASRYAESDQRRASVACPGCGHRQFLDFFQHVDWAKRRNDRGEVLEHQTKTARLHCERCGEVWSEGMRLIALQSTRWHQTRPFECCNVRHLPLDAYGQAWRAAPTEGAPAAPVDAVWDWWEDLEEGRHAVYRAKCPTCGKWGVDNRRAGFQASKLYSPWELDRPSVIADKWIKAKGRAELELVWWNTQMGLPHRPSSGKHVALDVLLQRREHWDAQVPDRVGVITVGADVQDFRVELEVVGWGRDEESWSIEHHVIDGEFSTPSVQAQVDAFLKRRWRRADGRTFAVSAACIDSGGHHTQAVYNFCKARLGRHIMAVKGASERDGQRNPVWPTKRPSNRNKAAFRPVIIGGNSARDVIRTRLAAEKSPAPGQPAPGYMHFPADRDVGYFEQLLADRLVIKEVAGRLIRLWETPSGKANEAADCRVYAYAALCFLLHSGVQLNKLSLRVSGPAPAAPLPSEAAAPPLPGAPMPPPSGAAAASPEKAAAARRSSIISRLA